MSTINPIPGSPDRALVAQDLRALADLVENDGDGFVAAMVAQMVKRYAIWPAHVLSHTLENRGRVAMAEAIRRFKTIADGPISKEYRDSGDGYFDATVPLRVLKILLTDMREEVCERVVTGTQTVTEEIPDPDYIAAAPMVTVTHEIESVEWKCAPILADAEAVAR